MGRSKGTRKTGGRKAGTPNKKTLAFQDFLSEIDFSLPKRIMEILPSLKEDKQVEVLIKLMAYAYPKYRSIEIRAGEDSGPENFAEWAQKNAEAYERRKRNNSIKSL